MRKSLFEYQDYKRYLADAIESMPSHGRGERTKLAQVLRCNIAYISQVLNGSAQLSLEQADLLNQYMAHSEAEADFFLLLVQIARAGSKSLKSHYLKKIDAIRTQRDLLKNRLQYQKELPEHIQPVYYSAWYYSAIHFLVGIEEYQSKEALSSYLGLQPSLVAKVLEFLVSAGLVVQRGDHFEIGLNRIHLGSDSPMISKHHANWKLQALQSLDRANESDLHYSSIITISKEHIPQIRALLVEAIERVRAVTKSSDNEVFYCYALDLFEVGASKPIQIDKHSIKKRKIHNESPITQH